MMFSRSLAVLLSALALVGCQTPVYQEQGWASHIADSYIGRMTSSGQVYYPNYYSAAHNTLPFGTEVTVKNLYTNQSVKAVVTDRFPYYPGRVINLSSAAAQAIGMPRMQLAQVKVVAYKVPQTNYATSGYGQQQGYARQPSYPVQQQYHPQSQQGYAQQQSYYPQQQAYSQPQQSQFYQPQQQAYGAPSYPAQPAQMSAPAQQQPKPSFFQRLRGGTPSAATYQGGGGTPPGLKTF
jgi:rare lipoprotein A